MMRHRRTRPHAGAIAPALLAICFVSTVGCGPNGNASTAGTGAGSTGSATGGSGTTSSGGTGSGGAACTAGLPSGFAAAPVPFSLPAARCNTSFDALAKEGSVTYDVLDLTGAGQVDLVVEADGCDAAVGTTRWDVYAASDTGFAAAPAPYAIPAPRCQTKFDASAKSGSVSFALLDLTADGRPDLVVLSDGCDSSVGHTHWDVYAGGATGFAAAPAAYALPAPRCNTPFDAAQKDGSVTYALADLTGDGRPDLVVSADGCDTSVGVSHWDVYAGGATGFAASPAALSLPVARCDTHFDALAKDGSVAYGLLDLAGTGKPGLVVTSDGCDATVGATHWDVYALGATGFAPSPTPFGVPAPRCQASFDGPAKSGSVSWGLVALSCDRRPAIVVTADGCDASVGATRWDVYANTGSSFAASPAPLAIPAARCQTRFDALASSGSVSFALTALRGKGPELVVSSDACDPSVGAAHWDIYPLH